MVEITERASARTVRYKDEYLRKACCGEAYLVFDGGLGTMLQQRGLADLASPADVLNLVLPEEVEAIHRAYVEAGAQVITTNTFNANAPKIATAQVHGESFSVTVREVYAAAATCARAAGARYVAGDIGPVGTLLEPLGTLSFDDAYALFAEQARAAEAAGCDLIAIETMTDLREAKAAVLAAVENTALPVFVTMTFGEDGRTFLGTTPVVAAATLAGLGVAAVGVNCSVGPDQMVKTVADMAAFAVCPIIAQPNAGMPRVENGKTVYDIEAPAFAQAMEQLIEAGATIVGGCCGTNPSFTQAIAGKVRDRKPAPHVPIEAFVVTSAQEAVVLKAGERVVEMIGERINPTGKKKLAQALRSGNYDYCVGEAVAQIRAGASILDVNAGLADIDEPTVLSALVNELAATITAPLQIDSVDPVAIEAAVRSYAGKPLINSVSGKEKSLEAVLPLAAKYGCALVVLTLNDDGIPPTAEERLAIAEDVVARAEAAGIPRTNIAVDCLVMAAATNQSEVAEVLRAVRLVKERLGVRTVLGVSNVSFGMPARGLLNATFLAAALDAGLDLPILNPASARYVDTVAAFRVINGQDAGAAHFVQTYADAPDPYLVSAQGNASQTATSSVAAPAATSSVAAPTAAPSVAAPAATPSAAAPAAASSMLAQGDVSAGQVSSAQAASSQSSQIASTLSTLPADARAVYDLVLEGRAAPIPALVEQLIQTHDALTLINEVLVSALDEVGQRYDAGTYFLPQLMASAEAAKAAFTTISDADCTPAGVSRVSADRTPAGVSRASADRTPAGAPHVPVDHVPADASTSTQTSTSCRVLLATVEGDIHDIGKNIVAMLLENYGFEVIDLGRDVPAEVVVEQARAHNVKLIGLSALMTTTVKAMERTIEAVHNSLDSAAVMVGGAVLTDEFAREIGADFYAKDAAASARIAQAFFANV